VGLCLRYSRSIAKDFAAPVTFFFAALVLLPALPLIPRVSAIAPDRIERLSKIVSVSDPQISLRKIHVVAVSRQFEQDRSDRELVSIDIAGSAAHSYYELRRARAVVAQRRPPGVCRNDGAEKSEPSFCFANGGW